MKKLRSFRDVLNFIRTAPAAAIMRLFTSRKSKYDELMRKVDGFVTILEASDNVTTLDVSGGPVKKGGKTVSFKDRAAVPIDNFKVPNRSKLAEDVQLFEGLEQSLEELEAMMLGIRNRKDPASRKFMKEMKEYHVNMTKQRDKLHDAMDDLSNKHLPPEMKKLIAALLRHVDATIPKDSYEGMSRDVYVTSHNSLGNDKDNEPIEFTCYLYIEGLMEDAFRTKELILVLTGTVHEDVSKAGSSFYLTFNLTALTRFANPGAFKEGKDLAGTNLSSLIKSMEKEATRLISMNSMMPHIGRRKLKATPQQIQYSGIMDVDGVLDVGVEEDNVVIKVIDMDDDVINEDLWPEIIVYLRKVLRAPRKSSFVYTIEKAKGVKYIRVSSVNNPASV